jgi:hypothetical protein
VDAVTAWSVKRQWQPPSAPNGLFASERIRGRGSKPQTPRWRAWLPRSDHLSRSTLEKKSASFLWSIDGVACRRDPAAMPLVYHIDVAQQLVTITGEYADAAEWQRVLGEVLRDPRLEPGFAFLRDLREATTPVNAGIVVGVMDVIRRFWPQLQPSRLAVLAPREVDPAAMVAHAIADAENIPLRMFRNVEDALAWLREGTPRRSSPPARV